MLTRRPRSIPARTTMATPKMLQRTCLGFRSPRVNPFLAANVVSNVGQNSSVTLVMYDPLHLIGATQLKKRQSCLDGQSGKRIFGNADNKAIKICTLVVKLLTNSVFWLDWFYCQLFPISCQSRRHTHTHTHIYRKSDSWSVRFISWIQT